MAITISGDLTNSPDLPQFGKNWDKAGAQFDKNRMNATISAIRSILEYLRKWFKVIESIGGDSLLANMVTSGTSATARVLNIMMSKNANKAADSQQQRQFMDDKAYKAWFRSLTPYQKKVIRNYQDYKAGKIHKLGKIAGSQITSYAHRKLIKQYRDLTGQNMTNLSKASTYSEVMGSKSTMSSYLETQVALGDKVFHEARSNQLAFIRSGYVVIARCFRGAEWKLRDKELGSEMKAKGLMRIAQIEDLLKTHQHVLQRRGRKNQLSWLVRYNNVTNYANNEAYNTWQDGVNEISISGAHVKALGSVDFNALLIDCRTIDIGMHTYQKNPKDNSDESRSWF